jgi:radical SAM/SPASM domain protein of ACGX system
MNSKPYFAFQWHVTDTCDQRCRHCYIFAEDVRKALTETPYERMELVVSNVLDTCDRLGRTPYLYVTGGDPILHKDFWRLCELLQSHGIRFAVMGNPFHLDSSVCKRLRAYGCVKYQLSIDGMREFHDHCRMPGSFDATVKAIDYVKESGMYCAIMSTVSSANVEDIPQVIDLVAERGVDVYAFGRYCPTSGQKSEEYHITPQDYRSFLATCWERFQYHESQGCRTTFQLKDHLWTLYLYEEGRYTVPKEHDPELIYDGCHCGIGHMTILPNGDVFACRRMDSRVGNAFESSLYDIFMGSQMDCYRQFDRFEKCSKCELRGYCRGCPAVSFGYSGSMYAPDPQCWKAIQ